MKKVADTLLKQAILEWGGHRDNSKLWRATVNNHASRESYFDKNGNVRGSVRYGMKPNLVEFHAHRVCYSHEYIGNGQKYPYTLGIEESNNQPIQLSLFDLLS